MAARLTDKQKKRIIADYIELGSYRATARKHGIAESTVRRLVIREPQTTQKAAHKKEENTADILAHMDRQKDKVCGVLDKYLEAMQDSEKIGRATLPQIATAMGILIDKYTAAAGNGQSLQKLDELLGQIGGVV